MLDRNNSELEKDQARFDLESGLTLSAQDNASALLRPIEPIDAHASVSLSEVEHTFIEEQQPVVTSLQSDIFTDRQVIASYATFVFSRQNYPNIISAAILTMLGTGLNFLAPYILGLMVESLKKEDATKEADWSQTKMITLLVLTYALAQIIPIVRERVLVPVAANNTKKLLMKITEHQLEKSLDYHINTPQGEQIYLLQKGFMVSEVGMPLLTKVVPTVVEVIIAVVALSSRYGTSMGGGLASLFAVYTAYSAMTTKPIIHARENMLNTGREAWTEIDNVITRYKTIHDFNKFDEALKTLEIAVQKAADAEKQMNNIPLDISYGQVAIVRMGMLAALLYVGLGIQQNKFSITEFIAIFGYLNQLSSTLPAVGDALNKVFASYPDLRFVFGELAKQSEIPDIHPENKLAVNGAASIRIENLTFGYPEKKPTFKQLSLEIKPGQTVALVSKSGGGKSTLFNLLYRYYDANAGHIYINDQNIMEISRVSLQQNIGLISQNPNLFNGTVRDNIKFAAKNPDAVTDNDLFELAQKLNLTGFICSLAKEHDITLENFSKGLKVEVGEAGKALSGGQQQKVAILRGFLKQTPIRLLDEITASLDAESAAAINQGIKTMTANTTTLVITHRLAEITNADVIFILDEGKVIAKGQHQELLQFCPLYLHLWRSQSLDKRDPEQPPVPSVTGFMGTFHHRSSMDNTDSDQPVLRQVSP